MTPATPAWRAALAGAVSGILVLSAACNRKEKVGVEYRGHSQEETADAVADAFGDGAVGAGEVDDAIRNLFVRLGKATRGHDGIDLDRLLSVDAMLEALRSAGTLDDLDPRTARGFEKGFRQGIEQVGESFRQMAYDDHKIMHIEAPAENERVVFVQHYDNELNVTFPMRWWLARTADGWRIYDYEDLSVGLRTVELMGTLMSAGIAGQAEPWVDDFIPVMTLMRSIDISDPGQLSGLEEPLMKLRRHEMPRSIRRFASTMAVSIYQVTGRTDEALAELEASRDGDYRSPMWHYQRAGALTAAGRFDESAAELGRHAETFGWDSDSLEMLSDCHFEAGRLDEARDAALRGLGDNPGSPRCLASLAAASSIEQLRDPATAELFAAGEDPESGYEVALDYLISLGKTEPAGVLFESLRSRHPDSELIPYYEEELAADGETAPTEVPTAGE